MNYSCVASGVLHFKMLPWPNVYIYSVFFVQSESFVGEENVYLFTVLNMFSIVSALPVRKRNVKMTLFKSLCLIIHS